MIVEALLANIVILLGLALALWVIAVQIDDVSFVDAYWGGGMAIMAVVSWLRLAEPGPLATLLMAMAAIWGLRAAIWSASTMVPMVLLRARRRLCNMMTSPIRSLAPQV